MTEPTAIGALNSERIVVRPSPTVVTYLAATRWNDRLPALVQARLIEAFQNSDGVRAVSPPGGAQVSDYGLVTDLRAFEVNAYDRQAVAELNARIIADSNGRVVASRRFRTVVPIPDTEAATVTAGLNAAFEGLSRDVVAWTLGAI
ncbi:putative ABC transporter protein [Lutibaculum baratangense AMV1]|uniref:Putative ABC transporter protein n=1 Tax=Lutibaculum baratangense AMV1 TaxID=631454 RepID=V4QWU3_9HYPH|nr:putative ABC transporter protein [Lutibaculum baratangense AMV1]